MARPTKTEIEKTLLAGSSIKWTDHNGKHCELCLADAKQRRLFAFLLNSKVRQPTALPAQFIADLAVTYNDTQNDPASTAAVPLPPAANGGPWRLQSVETNGFGGLNTWNGPTFGYELDQESLLIEGPNGSGKSSLIGAILWALSGERPREHDTGAPHEPRPVYGPDGKPIGEWPPIACYPPSPADIGSSPRVRVKLSFSDPSGHTVAVERKLENGAILATIPSEIVAIPSILMETGLFMPARLAILRFDGRPGPPGNAVQKLTGFDEFVSLAALVDGLCHNGREYLAYQKKELETARKQFSNSIANARAVLAPIQIEVPEFTPNSTSDNTGEMAKFGKMLSETAAKLAQAVSGDFAANFDLANPKHQENAKTAITLACNDLRSGLETLPSWALLKDLASSISNEFAATVKQALSMAQEKTTAALQFLAQSQKDNKFHLTAVAAQWHLKHGSGALDHCPLCENSLANLPLLSQQLSELRSAGSLAARAFDDNINAINAELVSSLPVSARKFLETEDFLTNPADSLIRELRGKFIQNASYSESLATFSTLFEEALLQAPKESFQSSKSDGISGPAAPVTQRIRRIEHLLALADWFHNQSGNWLNWWQSVAFQAPGSTATNSDQPGHSTAPESTSRECFSSHLSRISDALAKAEPYRVAAQSLRAAWQQGTEAAGIEKELQTRKAIAESIMPLKMLNSFADAAARDVIDALSTRILELHRRIHLRNQLQFHGAQIEKKQGLTAYGNISSSLLTDVSLVANASWLRSLLWAFLFALREEAIEQSGADPLPILVYDDPQMTFDTEHRHRWAQYVAGLQAAPAKVQVIIATHDETFLELIKVTGLHGRQAMIAAAGEELGHVGILEGDALDRKWQAAQNAGTPKAARDYIGEVRIYVEGILRLMLRGHDVKVMSASNGFVLGESRERIRQLNANGIAPWDRSEFNHLINALSKDLFPIKHMEMAHHSGAHLGEAEAEDCRNHWLKSVRPALERTFRVVREHHHLHGGLKALHAPTPTAVLPDGYGQAVKALNFEIVGQASALSDGQLADGRLDIDLSGSAPKKIVLAQHLAYRLTARTLEPVAQSGNLLLVKPLGEPSPKSLVIALHEDRILARRFEIAENQSDVAVLTAHAVNPRKIAPPVIAQKSTLSLHKIIGVLYQAGGAVLTGSMEACDCGGESAFSGLTTGSLKLIKVVGHSAEPYALDGQYLIIKNEVSDLNDLQALNGKPVIAADQDQNTIFKRLRLMPNELIVLESLDSAGVFEPVVLSYPGKGTHSLSRVWPVVGVLFELPI